MFFFSKFTLAANFHYCEDSSHSFCKNPQLVYNLNPCWFTVFVKCMRKEAGYYNSQLICFGVCADIFFLGIAYRLVIENYSRAFGRCSQANFPSPK